MVKAPFLDLFSRQAATYAAVRPSYPDELFAFLASVAANQAVAWDCATGNGQAARDLARYFDRVVATDASAEQLAHAVPVANVEYRPAMADASGLPSHSVDVVTVAQALHWLDVDTFYPEVRRVTVPGGIIAAWCYGYCHAGDDIEGALRKFEEGTVGGYWNPERRWVIDGYRTIPFPFDEIAAPKIELRVRWTLSQLGAYLSSWSAVAKYRRERGTDPVAPFIESIANLWGPEDGTREVTWPIGQRIGRIE